MNEVRSGGDRQGTSGQTDSPRVFVPPPLIFASSVAAGLAIDMHLHEFGVPQVFAILLLVAALGLIGAALNLFWRRRTRPEPWQPASALVVTGIYRFTRNPMYLGMTILSLSVAIFCQSLGAVFLSLVAAALIDRFVIRREEAYLQRRFGGEYRSYKQQVRRWL